MLLCVNLRFRELLKVICWASTGEFQSMTLRSGKRPLSSLPEAIRAAMLLPNGGPSARDCSFRESDHVQEVTDPALRRRTGENQ